MFNLVKLMQTYTKINKKILAYVKYFHYVCVTTYGRNTIKAYMRGI